MSTDHQGSEEMKYRKIARGHPLRTERKRQNRWRRRTYVDRNRRALNQVLVSSTSILSPSSNITIT